MLLVAFVQKSDKEVLQAAYARPEITASRYNQGSSDKLSIVPNPTNGRFYINTGQEINKVILLNPLGEVIKSFEGPGGKKVRLSLEGFPSGFYHVQVFEGVNNNPQNLRLYKH